MAKAALDCKIEGIVTPAGVDPAYPDPLYVPIEQETDIRPSFVKTTAAKVGTDPNVDIFDNIAAYPILLDLTGGAWNEYFDVNSRKYFEPYHTRATSGTPLVVQPLLWTLDPNSPLMVGPEHVADSNSLTFDLYLLFQNKLLALDKTNNKVYKANNQSTGTWTEITPEGLSLGTGKALTSLYVDAKGGTLLLGTNDNKTYRNQNSNPSSANWGEVTSSPIGAYFVTYGNDTYYVSRAGSNGYALLKRNVSQVKKQNPQYIGSAFKDVNAVLWADRFIMLGKPEGVYQFDPRAKQGAQAPLQPFPNADDDNGRVLFLHGRDVYFASADEFFSYNLNSGALLPVSIARFTGYAKKPFTAGRVLAGISDGSRIYLVYKVLNNDGSADNGGAGNLFADYYVLIGNGLDWHPVLAVSAWCGATDTSTNHAALFFSNNRLRYSMGGTSGYLRTDGKVPMVNAGASFAFSGDAAPCGITTGWIDAGRDWLEKWWKELRLSLRDRGTKGTVKVSYQKWGESPATWHTVGTLQGNRDNAALPFQEEDTTPDLDISDVVTSKINLLFELLKADTSENAVAHYLASAHLVGVPFYRNAFRATITAYLDNQEIENKNSGKNYNAQTVYRALLQAQNQAQPLRLTMPDKTAYYGQILPGANGIEILDLDGDTGKPRRMKYSFVFLEHA